jgi:hypothetical protein
MKSDSMSRVFTTYQRLRDCLTIAIRAIAVDGSGMIDGTDFVGRSTNQSRALIEETIQTIDDLTLVGLWAFFEREVVEYVQGQTTSLQTVAPLEFARPLHDKVHSEIERWRVDDLLDLFKGTIDANQVGRAKQIKDYRDWVAHRNPKRLPPAQMEPEDAYAVLLEIISELE